jgi:hypothetical protein
MRHQIHLDKKSRNLARFAQDLIIADYDFLNVATPATLKRSVLVVNNTRPTLSSFS